MELGTDYRVFSPACGRSFTKGTNLGDEMLNTWEITVAKKWYSRRGWVGLEA